MAAVSLDAVAQPGDPLTLREKQVLELIAFRGLYNPAIATELNLARDTIATYVKRILIKIGAVNRTQAATMAVRHGLVEVGKVRDLAVKS